MPLWKNRFNSTEILLLNSVVREGIYAPINEIFIEIVSANYMVGTFHHGNLNIGEEDKISAQNEDEENIFKSVTYN